jgi:hypothetical protein
MAAGGEEEPLVLSVDVMALELEGLKLVQRQEGQAGAELGLELRVEAARCIKGLPNMTRRAPTRQTSFLPTCGALRKRRPTGLISRLIDERLTRLQRRRQESRSYPESSAAVGKVRSNIRRPANDRAYSRGNRIIARGAWRSFNNFRNRISSFLPSR